MGAHAGHRGIGVSAAQLDADVCVEQLAAPLATDLRTDGPEDVAEPICRWRAWIVFGENVGGPGAPLAPRLDPHAFTRGSAGRLRTYAARRPCSATIQNVSPSSPLPTGVRLGTPDRRPVVSRIARDGGATPRSTTKSASGA